MRLAAFLPVLACAAAAAAQYFDDGWRPGQPAQAPAEPAFQPRGAPPPAPAPTSSLPSLSKLTEFFTIENLLSSGPSVQLFNTLGINITERLANATKAMQIWDERVPLITDENYADVIVNEELSEEEEKERIWLLIMCAPPLLRRPALRGAKLPACTQHRLVHADERHIPVRGQAVRHGFQPHDARK
jgi:hypothetical protein